MFHYLNYFHKPESVLSHVDVQNVQSSSFFNVRGFGGRGFIGVAGHVSLLRTVS